MKKFISKYRIFQKLSYTFIFLVFLLLSAVIFVFRPYSLGTPPRIPYGWGHSIVDKYYGHPAKSKSIKIQNIPQNPNLAISNSNNMHVDSYASDAHLRGGPLGVNPVVQSLSNARLGGQCATVTFDSRGNIVAVCATFQEFRLLLISPEDLSIITQMSLPPRASNKSLNLRKIMSDTSGGAYFFLDDLDRAVLIDADQKLRVFSQDWSNKSPVFVVEEEYDLKKYLIQETNEDDVITAVLPDWKGRYWFVSRFGMIAYIDPETEKISSLKLDNEEIQNSFAIDKENIYIVSDYALYALTVDENNKVEVLWREEYERSKNKKSGSITLGSGTTPTLLGDQYIAIADNAEPRINVLIYRRDNDFSQERLVCKTPVFKAGKSSTENTLIGIDNSVIVENNYGYDLFPTMMFGRTGEGGVARIDIQKNNTCFIKWESQLISQTTVPKISLQHGLVYLYTKKPEVGWGIDAYYLSALDFETGDVVFEKLTGTGVGYDNNWSPITLANNQCAYVGVLRGLVQICDNP